MSNSNSNLSESNALAPITKSGIGGEALKIAMLQQSFSLVKYCLERFFDGEQRKHSEQMVELKVRLNRFSMAFDEHVEQSESKLRELNQQIQEMRSSHKSALSRIQKEANVRLQKQEQEAKSQLDKVVADGQHDLELQRRYYKRVLIGLTFMFVGIYLVTLSFVI